MSNFSLKLDLSKFNGFGLIDLKGQSGQVKKCVVIPVEDNNLFLGDKGTYADLVCFETPNSDYGSHMVTISKTKEEQEAFIREHLSILGGDYPFEFIDSLERC